jgi:hypothetical protein
MNQGSGMPDCPAYVCVQPEMALKASARADSAESEAVNPNASANRLNRGAQLLRVTGWWPGPALARQPVDHHRAVLVLQLQ